jgi:hypothetical protein
MVTGAWLDRRLAALGGGRGKMEMEGAIFWAKTRFEVYSPEVGSAWSGRCRGARGRRWVDFSRR